MIRSKGAVAVREIAPDVPPASNILLVSQLKKEDDGEEVVEVIVYFFIHSPRLCSLIITRE